MANAQRLTALTLSSAYLAAALCCGSAVGADVGETLSLGDLQGAHRNGALIPNAAFAPASEAAAALEPFEGILTLGETRMATHPSAFKSALVLDRDPQLFPAVKLAFFTDSDALVPVDQDVIPAALKGRGHSYWSFIVQPGAVWSTPCDHGWSRAGFPFALVNSLEGETHNGVATFGYRAGRVTNLRVQIVQQTAPFYIEDYFTAWAQIGATWSAAPPAAVEAARLRYHAALRDRLPIGRWEDLLSQLSTDHIESPDEGVSAADIVLSAFDYDGTVYLRSCDTAAGPMPWCDRVRFGVWSATKSLVNEIALLHLAQKYGPRVFDERIVDYVPQAAAFPGWRDVRFTDAADMATGVGNGSVSPNPNHILEGGLENYSQWYEARTEQQKVQAALTGAKPFPWGPGRVARYRDQDMYILGVAMDNFVKKKDGAAAGVWPMLLKEVFEPIGIYAAPINKTLEPTGRMGQPLMAFGFYPTVTDIVRIARLYQNAGSHDGRQLLYAPRIRDIFSRTNAPGLPTGQSAPAGEGYYFNAFWKVAYHSAKGCNLYFPEMQGYGGTVVGLFPGKVTGIRIAKVRESDTSDVSVSRSMAALADQLHSPCP